MLPETYIPTHKKNRMKHEGNVSLARKDFIEKRPSNLEFLLRTRYLWMEPYLKGKKDIFELGSGAGFSKMFLKDFPIILTDVEKFEWIERKIDALNLPFAPNSVDIFILSHMIHHVAYPKKFLINLSKALKPNGLILINEINTSFIFKILSMITRHEGWNYKVCVFDGSNPANDPNDPWSANCAIPELLFENKRAFEGNIKELKVERNEFCEFLIFILSGGVIAKIRTINLPKFILKIIHTIDLLIVKMAPKLFALSRRIVLKKDNSARPKEPPTSKILPI